MIDAPSSDDPPWRDPVFVNGLAYTANAQAAPSRGTLQKIAGTHWSTWAEGIYTRFDRSGPAATSGHSEIVTGGLDYRVAGPFIAGFAFGYETQRFNTKFNGGFFRGSGPTIGPYASWLMSPNVMVNVTAGLAALDHSVSDGSALGHYHATRYFASGSIIGTWRQGLWRFSPRVNAYYASDQRAGYVDTMGLAIPSGRVTAGRLSAGPEIGYSLLGPHGLSIVEPFMFAALECDFTNRGAIVATNGAVINDSACGGRAGGGIKGLYASSVSSLLRTSYNSIGRSDQNSWTLQGQLQWNF